MTPPVLYAESSDNRPSTLLGQFVLGPRWADKVLYSTPKGKQLPDILKSPLLLRSGNHLKTLCESPRHVDCASPSFHVFTACDKNLANHVRSASATLFKNTLNWHLKSCLESDASFAFSTRPTLAAQVNPATVAHVSFEPPLAQTKKIFFWFCLRLEIHGGGSG